MDSVMSILRYPVKSARGERLSEVEVTADGLAGDREWACLDVADGTVGSLKHPRRWGRLLDVGATATGPAVTVHVNEQALPAGSPQADAALTAHLGRDVRLSRTVPDGARLHRELPDLAGMVPDWMASAAPGSELVTDIAGARPGGRFVDFGAVHLVSTGALAGLAGRLGRAEVPATRFRPNLVIDAPADPDPGTELRVGDAVLRVLFPTPRCVVPGLDKPEAPTDRALLAELAGNYRINLPGFGRAACFGSYAEVLQPGRIQVGQTVS
jgi:uncharacterized protein YcbX